MNDIETESTPPAADGQRRPRLITLGLITIAMAGVRTITNADFWTHLALGRDILKNGIQTHDPLSFTVAATQPWMNASWLYDAMMTVLWRVGSFPLLTLAHIAAAILAFLLLIPVARKYAGDACIGFSLILSAWLLASRFEVRPFVWCWPLVAFFIFILSGPKRTPALALLLPAQALWTNLHDSFFLGPLIAALFAVQAYLARDDEEAEHVGRLALLTAGLVAATLVNPYGLGPWRHVLRSAMDPSFNVLLEWISPFSNHFQFSFSGYLVTATLVVIAAGFVAYRQTLPPAITAMAVMVALVLVRTSHYSARYADASALIAFPFICLSVRSVIDFARERWSRTGLGGGEVLRHGGVLVTVLLAVASVGSFVSNLYYNRCGSASSFGVGAEFGLFPNAAVRTLMQRHDFPVRAVNLPADGGFLAWTLPARKIFTDSRETLYSLRFFQDLEKALLTDGALWNKMVDQWKPDAVVISCCWANAGTAINRLMASGQWKLAYFDGVTAVLLSPVSSNRSMIQDESIRAAGLAALEAAHREYRERLSRERFPPNPPALIGASFVFQSLGQYREAAEIYKLLLQGAPSMLSTWVNLGICQEQLGDSKGAVLTLEYAAELLPKNAITWIWLEKTYRSLGRAAEAESAHAMAHALGVNTPARPEQTY